MSNHANESRLVYEVMQELGKLGAVFRTNAGSVRLSNGRTFHGLPKGFSDILHIRRDGKACFIETKIKPNKATPEQLAFIEKMRNHGCVAGVVYSLDEALQLCEYIN
jgi:hypothetical protein